MGEEFVKPNEISEESLNEIVGGTKEEASSEESQEVSSVEDDWKPDYKVKVLDKEYEIDEELRPILNKNNYNKYKELYEKAYGLDSVKQKYHKVNEELEAYKPYLKDAIKNSEVLGQMGTLLNRKDYETLLRELQIPDAALYEIAIKKARMRDMSPEERQVYETQQEDRQRLYSLEIENQRKQQQLEAHAVQARVAELNNYLSHDSVRSIAESYDSQVGQPGAFRREVIERGKFAAHNLGKDLSVEEAVKAVIYDKQLYNSGVSSNQGQVRVANSQSKPIIPNIKSSGVNPAKKTITSLDELRKLGRNFKES